MVLGIECKAGSKTILSSPVLPNLCQSKQQLSGLFFCCVLILFSTNIMDTEKEVKQYCMTQVASYTYPMKFRSPELLVNSSHHSIKDKSLVEEKTDSKSIISVSVVSLTIF